MAVQKKSRCNLSRNGFWQNSFATDSASASVGKDTVQGNRPGDFSDVHPRPSNQWSGSVHLPDCLEAGGRLCTYPDRLQPGNLVTPWTLDQLPSPSKTRPKKERKQQRQEPTHQSAETIATHLKPSAISS
jgi:hypothetical protein